MRLGDKGDDVRAFQASVFPASMVDGVCGLDTLSRWRADNDSTVPFPLRRMFRMIGKIIDYSMANVTDTANDCSGSVCLSLPVSKGHGGPGNPTALDFGTGGILADALGGQRVFAKVCGPDVFDRIEVADLLIYGPHDGHAGHIAYWLGGGAICDCSASRNGVHAHLDDKAQFMVKHPGRPVYVVRYVGARKAQA